jgi:hypothetical protein
MRSEVSQLRQPHDSLEINNQTGGNESGQEYIYSRAQSLGKLASEVLALTAHKVTGRNTKGASYSMISEPVRLAEALPISKEGKFCDLVRLCVGFGQVPKKEIEHGKFLRRTNISYVPDPDNVTNVGVIYLSAPEVGTEPTHEGSSHWYRTDFGTPEVFDAIEQGIEAIKNSIGRLTVVQAEIAS